jgi:transposase
MVPASLEAIVVTRPQPSAEQAQGLCLDKGYDYDAEVRQILEEWGYTAHIWARGEEARDKAHLPGCRARRWVVKRTHSWLNRCCISRVPSSLPCRRAFRIGSSSIRGTLQLRLDHSTGSSTSFSMRRFRSAYCCTRIPERERRT